MQWQAKRLLEDIRAAAELVRKFTAGRSLDDYCDDAMLQSAVERQLEIIGAAVRRLCDCDPALARSITDCDRIIAFQNLLVPGYDAVDAVVVWEVVQSGLPRLAAEVASLLNAADG